MKILIVFLGIIALTFGEVVDTTLSDDLTELFSLFPRHEISKLVQIYKNDSEFRAIVKSEDFPKVTITLFMNQPEFQEYSSWLSKYVKINEKKDEHVEDIHPEDLAKYKPGWKGYVEAYKEIYPTDKIIAFIKQKVAEDEEFAEFWGKVKALVPVFERVIALPEYVAANQRLEALGFDNVEKRIYRTIIESV